MRAYIIPSSSESSSDIDTEAGPAAIGADLMHIMSETTLYNQLIIYLLKKMYLYYTF